MGRRADLSAIAESLLANTGDIAEVITYRSFTGIVEDVAAGTSTGTFTDIADIKAIFVAFDSRQIDGAAIRSQDEMALIPAKNIADVTPGLDDLIVRGTDTWEVVRVWSDPALALWKIQVRRP